MMQRRDLVLLSGGLDSSTALALRAEEGTVAGCVSVDYGQRHARELQAAGEVAAHYDVPHQVMDLSSWGRGLSGSALTDEDVEVPDGHYAASTTSITVVPNRNAVLLMAAAGVALSQGMTHVVAAVHAGDHHVYPDCRPEFVASARTTVELGTDGAVSLDAPFVHMSKTAIAARAHDLGLPVELTWSCYKGREQHCGVCGTCVERQEAFTEAGVPDPTGYETHTAVSA